MSDVKEIQSFFDTMSEDRNHTINADPWLQYEQAARYRAVLELLEISSGEQILDAGAGNLRDSALLLRYGARVHALDLSVQMLYEGLRFAEPGESLSCAQGSALLLPFSNQSFDKILCSEMIEHVPGFEAVFAEFHRCLKPGGALVVTTPNWHSLYGLNRKLVEKGQKLLGRNPWHQHPYDEWKHPDLVEHVLSLNHFRIERWIGICYLPGFSVHFVPLSLQRLIVRLTQTIEPTIRLRAAKWGYGIGVRAVKAE